MDVEEGLDTGGTYACLELPIDPDDRRRAAGRLVEVGTELLVDALVAGLGAPRRRWASRPTPRRSTRRARDRLEPLGGARSTASCGSAAPGRPTTVAGSRCGGRTGRRRSSCPPGTGALLLEVQPEGKGRMAAATGPTAPAVGRRAVRFVTTARRPRAIDALVRIDVDGAYANLAAARAARPLGLADRDRPSSPSLVYGTTRMRRACDWLVDRFVDRELDPPVRHALRLGAYQLLPRHAAACRGGETVEAVPESRAAWSTRSCGGWPTPRDDGPDDATRLSYPDWIVERLVAELGAADAIAALEAMNEPPPVTERADGYVQDRASQWVAEAVGARPGERVARPVRGTRRQGHRSGRRRGRGRRPRPRPSGPGSSPPTPAASNRAGGWRRGRRPRPSHRRRSTGSSSTPLLRPRRCAGGPTPGGGSTSRRRPSSPPCSADSWTGAAARRPGGTLVYSSARSPPPESTDVADRDRPSTRPTPPADPWEPWGAGPAAARRPTPTAWWSSAGSGLDDPPLAKVLTVSDGVVHGTARPRPALAKRLAEAGSPWPTGRHRRRRRVGGPASATRPTGSPASS